MGDIMIDRKDLSVKLRLETKEGDFIFITPDPIKERVAPIISPLGFLLSDMTSFDNMFLFRPILQADVNEHIDIACEKASEANRRPVTVYKQAFDNFFQSILVSTSVITPTLEIKQFEEIKKDFTENQINYIKGSYLFFYIILRYVGVSEIEETDFFTLLNVTEILTKMKTKALE